MSSPLVNTAANPVLDLNSSYEGAGLDTDTDPFV